MDRAVVRFATTACHHSHRGKSRFNVTVVTRFGVANSEQGLHLAGDHD